MMTSPNRFRLRTVATLAGVLSALSGFCLADPLSDYHRALDLVERSLAAHGGLGDLRSAGGFEMTLEGTFAHPR